MSSKNKRKETTAKEFESPDAQGPISKEELSQLRLILGETVPVDLFTIKNLANKHSNFLTESKIRWWIYKEAEGINECLIRVSNRIFISESKLLSFMFNYESRNEGS